MKITLYHYTSVQSADSILDDGFLLPSTDVQYDAHFGEGVYLTDIAPYDLPKKDIANYLYLHGGRNRMYQGKLDAVIRVHVPRGLVQLVDKERRIFIFNKSGPLYVDRHYCCHW